ncbi:hypothetical protein DSO57_1015255 [Entomophthora muscae]|uniref:Uncharacterized protein n=1 Tax=Entomophthora muscae TaxID=34485 RepID=A0ACC2T553_9FUNG|nr:hypothetical protein DSO57_1015255 [Entomophthora muscae]
MMLLQVREEQMQERAFPTPAQGPAAGKAESIDPVALSGIDYSGQLSGTHLLGNIPPKRCMAADGFNPVIREPIGTETIPM